MTKKLSAKKAFTIIEVVLVLAIAGLIMLAVFIAVPALQRASRNTVRKDDMSRIMRAIVSYQNNHNGRVPIYYVNEGDPARCNTLKNAEGSKACFKIAESFVKKYIDKDAEIYGGGWNGGYQYQSKCTSDSACSDFRDPNGGLYIFKVEGLAYVKGSEMLFEFDRVVHLAAYSKCASSGSEATEASGHLTKTKNPNDATILYRLEGNAVFCVDNQ